MKRVFLLAMLVIMSATLVFASGSTESASTTGTTYAQDGSVQRPDKYPNGVVSFIVPAPAGAANDLATRSITNILKLGGNVVVENIVGASQTIGTAEAARRNANGQTVLTCANVGMILAPISMGANYTWENFRHIAMISPPITMTICVKAGSDVKTSADWLKLVQSDTFSTFSHAAGAGGLGHVAATDFLGQLNSKNSQFVAYNGNTAVLQALMNGEIDWAILDVFDAVAQQEAGNLVPILIIAQEANEHTKMSLPGVPTMASLGVTNMENFVGLKWLAVKEDTPDNVVAWMKQQLNIAIQSDSYQNWLESTGYGRVDNYSEEQITALVKNSYEKSKALLASLGIAK
jgi:tripartite-type tricarboxylate transporter receptor subunit TctC